MLSLSGHILRLCRLSLGIGTSYGSLSSVRACSTRRWYGEDVKTHTSKHPYRMIEVRRWTPEDDDKLLYLRKQNMRYKEMVASFPGRSERSIRSHYPWPTGPAASQPISSGKKWSEHELELVSRMLSEGIPTERITEKLPGRSYSAVATIAGSHTLCVTGRAITVRFRVMSSPIGRKQIEIT